jgi:hypothetical protein
MMRRIGFSVAALTLLAATPALAADVALTVTGTPTSVVQGASAGPFTITIAITGSINLKHIPAQITVQTGYMVGGDTTYGTPADRWVTAPATAAAGCETFGNGPASGECKPAQSAVLMEGSVSQISAYLTAPADLTPGTYQVCIVASVSEGLSVGTLPCFYVEVTQASNKPIVTIIEPNGHTYNFGATVNVSVDVASNTALTAVTAAVNGAGTFPLVANAEDLGNFTGTFRATHLCSNRFMASATNSAGETTATSSFIVNVPF